MNRSTSAIEPRITRSTMLAGLLLALGCASTLSAQLNSTVSTISLHATTSESISISITAGAAVTFSGIVAGTSVPGNVVPAFTTTWILDGSRTSVKVYAYFSSSNALVGSGSMADVIPASALSGTPTGGMGTAFTGTVPFGGSNGLLVSTTAISSANLSSSKSDTVALTLNVPTAGFASDTYTGTLNIQAQATP